MMFMLGQHIGWRIDRLLSDPTHLKTVARARAIHQQSRVVRGGHRQLGQFVFLEISKSFPAPEMGEEDDIR